VIPFRTENLNVMNKESSEAGVTEYGTGSKRKSQRPRYLKDYVAK